MRKLPMRFTSGCSAELRQPLMIRMARYRHRVFVERLGWKLHCRDALELDQFDRDDTIYVIAQNEDGEVIGTARLLPTTRPYLLAEVFPHLLNGAPAPDAPDVWELSRFASMDLSGATGSALDQFSSPFTTGLLQTASRCAMARGARRLVSVSPLGMERLLRRTGFESHRLGPPTLVQGRPLFACSIRCK
jgi:acyl homoserine lactone synthase